MSREMVAGASKVARFYLWQGERRIGPLPRTLTQFQQGPSTRMPYSHGNAGPAIAVVLMLEKHFRKGGLACRPLLRAIRDLACIS